MATDLRALATVLALQEKREVDVAVALIWALSHQADHETEVELKEVVELLAQLRLRASVNPSRLKQNLAKHPDLLRGRRDGTFRIRVGSEEKLFEMYGATQGPRASPVGDKVIQRGIGLGGRKYLEEIRRQANGSYDQTFYDASAVMCRRLVELLLIEAFSSAGHLAAISNNSGELKPFGDIVAAAKSKAYIKLSRTAPQSLDRVKQVGDAAAHHRHYTTTQRDIDELNPGLRHLLAELSALAFPT